MIKLKNISQEDIVLNDLGMQLLQPNETVDLDCPSRKDGAANSSQIITLLSDSSLAVIDNDDIQVTELSIAIDIIKGFNQKYIKTSDDKLISHETSRPIGTYTNFISEGDDPNDPTKVGGGTEFFIEHEIGQPLEQTITVDLNIKENKTFVHEGYIMWENSNFDTVCFSIIPVVTNCTPGTNTYFNLYGGYLIVPAAGDGTINVAPQDIRLVEMPYQYDKPTERTSPAFWNADYSTETHQFSNITAAPYGNGQYNMFAADVMLVRIANIKLLNQGFMMLQTADVSELGHGMRIRFGIKTRAPDHDWKAAIILTLNRVKTC